MGAAVKAIHLAATGASDVEGEEPAALGGEEVSAERPSGAAGVHPQAQLELAGDR